MKQTKHYDSLYTRYTLFGETKSCVLQLNMKDKLSAVFNGNMSFSSYELSPY